MPSSAQKLLLDENVRAELYAFLTGRGVDAKYTPRGLSNGKVAELTQREKRVLVTNDSDLQTQLFILRAISTQLFGSVYPRIKKKLC